MRSGSVESGGNGEGGGAGGGESLGSGDTAEALGGSGGDWGGDGLEGDERAGPGLWCPNELERLIAECVSANICKATTTSFFIGSTPQGDDGNHRCCVNNCSPS